LKNTERPENIPSKIIDTNSKNTIFFLILIPGQI